MMVQVAHGVPRPVGLATWCAVRSVATSCRVIASAIPAHVRSAVWRCTIERLYSRLPACFERHDVTVYTHVLQAPR
jgi:hypothetical protein